VIIFILPVESGLEDPGLELPDSEEAGLPPDEGRFMADDGRCLLPGRKELV
jgi:hypothetical protein